MVAALARALQLTDDERDHLYRLAAPLPPLEHEVSDQIPPGLNRVLTRLGDLTAAALFAADWQLIWWIRAWAALVGDPALKAPHLRNFARDTFPTGPGGEDESRLGLAIVSGGVSGRVSRRS